MRHREEPLVFGVGKCALGDCLAAWQKWCRKCNLVYCGIHIEPENHKCRALRPVGKEGRSGEEKPLRSGPAREEKGVPEHPANGSISRRKKK